MTTQSQSLISSEKPAPGSHHGASQDAAQNEERRRSVVAVAAYYLAERRQFEPGFEVQDWLAAERQVSREGK